MKLVIAVVALSLFATANAGGGLLGGLGGIIGNILTGPLKTVVTSLEGSFGGLTGAGSGHSCGVAAFDFFADISTELETILSFITNFTSLENFQIGAIVTGLNGILNQLASTFSQEVIDALSGVFIQMRDYLIALLNATINNAINVIAEIIVQIAATFTIIVDFIALITATASDAVNGAANGALNTVNSAIASLLGVFSVISTATDVAVVAAHGAVHPTSQVNAQIELLSTVVGGVLQQLITVLAGLSGSFEVAIGAAGQVNGIGPASAQLQVDTQNAVETVAELIGPVSGALGQTTGLSSTDTPQEPARFYGGTGGSVFASLDVVFSVTAQVTVVISTVTD